MAELIVACAICFVVMGQYGVLGTRTLKMEASCNAEISMILLGLYQAQLDLSTSSSGKFTAQPSTSFESSRDTSVCDTRIEAWYNKPHIMFYFDHLELDCDNGYLDFFDGYEDKYSDEASVRSLPISDELTRLCGNTKPSGVYTTQTRDLRIQYTTLKPAVQESVFKIIVTAYIDGEGSCANYEYKCDNDRCIQKDVSCNDHNSCGDNSAGCGLQLATITIIRIVGGCVFFIILIIAIVVLVRRIRRKRQQRNQNGGCPPVQYTSNQLQQLPCDEPTVPGQSPYYTPPSGQPTGYAPPPGQPTYYTPPPGQPTGYAPPTGQLAGYAPPPGQPTDYTPSPGQPTEYAPPPGKPSDVAQPPGHLSYPVPPPT